MDAGAALSIISETTYSKVWPADAPPLSSSYKQLQTYTGELLEVKGTIVVTVEYQNQQANLELAVVAGSGPSLLGRDWLQEIRLDWPRLNQI